MAKRKQNTITLIEKEAVLQLIEGGKGYSEIASIYKIGKSTIGDIFKKKEQIRSMIANIATPEALNRKTLKRGHFPEIEDQLYHWYMDQQETNVGVTNDMFKTEAHKINKQINGENSIFNSGLGWLSRFKKRYGIPASLRRNNYKKAEKNESEESDAKMEVVEIEQIEYYEDLDDTEDPISPAKAMAQINSVLTYCVEKNYSFEDQHNLMKVRDKITHDLEFGDK